MSIYPQNGTTIGVMPATGPDACLQECINMGEDPPDGPVCGSYTFYANETLCILFEEFCGDNLGACASYPDVSNYNFEIC